MLWASSGVCVFLSRAFNLVLPSLSRKMDPNNAHVARRIANVRRDNPQANVIRSDVSGSADESPAAPSRGAPSLNLGHPEIYSEFFKVAAEFAFFPNTKCHFRAEVTGSRTGADAWKWIAGQADSNLPDTQCPHADLAGNIGAA